MEHLKTESEHIKNEVEGQREVIKVLRESYYNALFEHGWKIVQLRRKSKTVDNKIEKQIPKERCTSLI